MAQTNKQRLDSMLTLVGEALGPYVEAALTEHYGKNWRQYAAFPDGVSTGGGLDVQAYLRLVQNEWRDVFSKLLDRTARDAVTAVNAGRNAWAHPKAGQIDVPNDLTLRALSAGAELMEAIGAPKAKATRALYEGLIQQIAGVATAPAEPAATAPTAAPPSKPPRPTLTLTPKSQPREVAQQLGLGLDTGQEAGSLEPWRLVAPPREDITTGQLTLDHFAANLAVVDRGEVQGAYGDPDEFFRSTHMTHGLKLVLEGGARRLMGMGGPSVIGLQTNFGGGKTHTMLALLHLARAAKPGALQGLRDIVGDNPEALRGAKAVAFSGSDKGPDVPLAFAGTRGIRTIWGYLAFRLAGEEGLRIVAGAEEAGTNPGGEAFEKVLRASGGPALILLDEIVAYVKQLGGERYDANLAFFQSLTEAAARVPQALVVGSLPESEDEAGGDRGKETLAKLEKLFGRTQSSWQAAQGTETYAIVRRRLFQELDDAGIKARDKTLGEYRKLYRDHKQDFPKGSDEQAYLDLMREAYPVHPMLFDKLAQEWGGLDKFQRTRGVLKFIAEAARRIWLNQSQDPLIQVASLPLADPLVRGAVLEPLDGAVWPAIVDGEVESDRALPVRLDSSKQRFGERRIATRAARAVFLGTAPRGDAGGGMARADVNLACAMPGENVAVFGDALSELVNQSGHLRGKDGAFWFGSDATLRKVAEARARERSDAEADEEIAKVLRTEERHKGKFARVHTCLRNPEEVEEATSVALVVLHPETPHDPKSDASPAIVAASDALKRRSGGRQRLNRNMLLFVAADASSLVEARKAAKYALAWRSIAGDTSLDLRDSHRKEATEEANNADGALLAAVRRCWSHIIVPSAPREEGEPFSLERVPLRNGNGKTVPEAVWASVERSNQVLTKLGPQTLGDRIRDAWPADEPHVALSIVRDWFFQYVRFDRVRDELVLQEAVTNLVAEPFGDFAYAAGVEDTGRYTGIAIGRLPPQIELGAGLLVKRAVAEAQRPAPNEGQPGPGPGLAPNEPKSPGSEAPMPAQEERRPRRFFGSVDLDPQRPVRDLQAIFDSVISELSRTPGAKVSLRLEIDASAAGGFSRDDASIIRDNARSLRFRPEATGFADD